MVGGRARTPILIKAGHLRAGGALLSDIFLHVSHRKDELMGFFAFLTLELINWHLKILNYDAVLWMQQGDPSRILPDCFDGLNTITSGLESQHPSFFHPHPSSPPNWVGQCVVGAYQSIRKIFHGRSSRLEGRFFRSFKIHSLPNKTWLNL